ncbi:oligosaccharide flippase family protein [Vibrio vulnificus]|uniref:oligosaccharide flippase family protein n=2 Tax=Vibrio vulnificus TaxID=672 RepID=UPI004057F35B
MMLDRYKLLIKNTLIFTLSTLGNKAVALILIPIYSHSLSLAEFGEVDIALTVIMLLMPVITASLYEAVQKYCILIPESRERILSSALLSFVTISAFLGIIVGVIYLFVWTDSKVILLYWILLATSFYEFFARFAKGTSNEVKFALANIALSLALLCLNLVFVYKQGMGVNGVLLSQALAYTLSMLLLCMWLKLWKLIHPSSFEFQLLQKMLKLSAPLILNAAMWWIFDVSDRWIILYFEDASAVGLYSVACKLAAILLIVHTILFQAWQISAVAHKHDIDRGRFYMNVSTLYVMVIFTACSVLIVSSQFLLESTLSDNYSQAWQLGCYLLLSTVFFSLASFFGVFYVAFEKTKNALYSSVSAAIINIVMNFILIPYFGVVGAAYGTVISTFFLLLFRIVDTQKLCGFKFNKFLFLILISAVGFQLYLSLNEHVKYSILISFCLVSALALNLIKRYKSLVGKYV